MNFSAELAALKKRVAALEASTPAAIEARRRQDAAEERQQLAKAAEATRRMSELREANERQGQENWNAHQKAEKARRDANRGRFRDHCGIWRGADGRQLSDTEAANAAAIDQKWKEDHQ